MSETWVPIQGYEGLYEVSDQGQVRSLDRYVNGSGDNATLRFGKVLKPRIDRYGYQRIHLSDGKYKTRTIHRLVAVAFIPNPDNLPEVNHRDYDKQNNYKHNLEWVSQIANAKHASANGRATARKNPRIIKKLTVEDADILRLLRAEGASIEELTKWFSISRTWAKYIISGKWRK